MAIPNTATTQVAYLITTEWGLSPVNAYQVGNTSPFVWGRSRTYAGVTQEAAATAATVPVVSPVPVNATAAENDGPSDNVHSLIVGS